MSLQLLSSGLRSIKVSTGGFDVIVSLLGGVGVLRRGSSGGGSTIIVSRLF